MVSELYFKEYLRASDFDTFSFVEQMARPEKLPLIILDKLKSEYRRYMVTGGMPEATMAMLENQGMLAVDDILRGILDMYELDFAKYAGPREIPRIHAIWHSLPSQFAKESRKFVYNVIKTGARSRDISICFSFICGKFSRPSRWEERPSSQVQTREFFLQVLHFVIN